MNMYVCMLFFFSHFVAVVIHLLDWRSAGVDSRSLSLFRFFPSFFILERKISPPFIFPSSSSLRPPPNIIIFFFYICFISFLFFICSGGNVVRATLRRGMIEMIFVTFLHTPCFISIHFVAKPLPPPPLPEKFVFFFFLNNKTKHKQPHTHSHTHSYTHSHTKTIMIIPGLTLLSSSQLS